jgi:hypothetical protein
MRESRVAIHKTRIPARVLIAYGRCNSIVVAAAVWAFAIAYWFMPGFGGKTFFRGPQTHDQDLNFYSSEMAVDGPRSDVQSEEQESAMKK